MKGLIPLGDKDFVFLRGDAAYALVSSRNGWKAAEVVERNGSYYRREETANLSPETVNGIVCQQEFFAPSRLSIYWKRRATL